MLLFHLLVLIEFLILVLYRLLLFVLFQLQFVFQQHLILCLNTFELKLIYFLVVLQVSLISQLLFLLIIYSITKKTPKINSELLVIFHKLFSKKTIDLFCFVHKTSIISTSWKLWTFLQSAN